MMLVTWYVVPPFQVQLVGPDTNGHTRTSATNAARIYNSWLSQNRNDTLIHGTTGTTSFTGSSESELESDSLKIELPSLRPEHVWDGFTILSLLEDLESRAPKAFLSVPHGGNQRSRFDRSTVNSIDPLEICHN